MCPSACAARELARQGFESGTQGDALCARSAFRHRRVAVDGPPRATWSYGELELTARTQASASASSTLSSQGALQDSFTPLRLRAPIKSAVVTDRSFESSSKSCSAAPTFVHPNFASVHMKN